MARSTTVLVLLLFSAIACSLAKYDPTWESLDSRPNPAWYNEAKFGIIMHWGVYSVPGIGTEWFWKSWKDGSKPLVDFMKKNYPPGFTYPDFAPMFKAEFFDPDEWADLLAKSGARYYVLTSKHHEGFTLWGSSQAWNWNAVDTGPHRDLVGELAKSIRSRTNVTFGLYHSLFEWFHPLYLKDRSTDFETNYYVREVVGPQLYDIVNTYKPHYIFSDGDWQGHDTYWNSTNFLAWLYNESPVKDSVLVNDRWGVGTTCHHGGVFTCIDKYNPGHLVKHKWENARPLDKASWGYRRNMNVHDVMSMDELTDQLTSTVSCGGNLLLNVGPTSDGRICPLFQERLTQMGEWLRVNGEGIYSTRPWRAQKDSVTPGVWYTSKAQVVYAFMLDWPQSGSVQLTEPVTNEKTTISMLGLTMTLPWKPASDKGGVVIDLSSLVVADLPCQWAWAFKFVNVQ